MSRLLQNRINNDAEIIRLRMDVEDLVNSMDTISEEAFNEEATKLKLAIDKRTNYLISLEK